MNAIDHPAHYGGASNPYEAIKVIEAWGLGFCLGNCVKYIARAGRKDAATHIEDLEKAAWYLAREIECLKVLAKAEAVALSPAPPAPPPAAMPFKARGGYTIPFAHRNSPQPPVRKIKLTRERRAKVKKALHAIVGWSEYRHSKGWTGGLRYAQIMEACQFFSLNPITLRRKP